MYKQITIKTLDKQGVKHACIARELSCHRNTVTNILKKEKLTEKQTRVKPSIFAAFDTRIEEYLDKKVANLRIYEILKEEYGVQSTYVNLCKYIQKHFPKHIEAYGVQVTLPGEVAEIDFGYLGMLPGPLNTLVKTYGLAVVLGYSRLDYYAIVYDQRLETLCRELTDAFSYFGGVPRRLKVDNMKTAVLKNQHYDLTLNQDFLEFASHYGTVVIPCTPYSPEQKGKVEGAIKYLQINFIAGRTFQDGADLKKQAREWMEEYANQRIHGTTRKVPMQVFLAEEKEKLQALPLEEFSFFNRGIRTVAPNCHIHFENNYYSVPAFLVGKEVTIRWNEHLVRIIYQGEQIALHHKVTVTIGNFVTQRNHLPDYKIYSQTEYQARYETKMADIGEWAHQYFTMLLEQKENYWFRTVRGILGLKEIYGREAVNLSLKRAMYYQAADIVTIKHILEKNLYLLEIEPIMGKTSDDNDDNSMNRSLGYYEGVSS
ncbi:MAG: hypothetical protein A3D75_00705 [Candidatus Levybacteria bacterium RIFCSPHIGHO2_02_FULL_37_18]|nr:MAG: hypothetical protein A3D75_00705 [Candidatus Levybacteria bacterium RIFCSPHIGHO2_02_FULL_37_18]